MTKERMLELLLLERYKDILNYGNKKIDWNKYWLRLEELREEFLGPYVIDNALNGD